MNTIKYSNLLQAISLAQEYCRNQEEEQVRRTEEKGGRKQPEFVSAYRQGLKDVLDKAIKGERIVIVD